MIEFGRPPAAAAATVLAEVAERIRPLLPAERQASVREAVERAQVGRVRVLVIGEAKRGKSTLVNALFERELLPTGALPLTSVASVVTVADRTAAEVRYLDGRVESIGLDEVGGLVSQRGNPDNVKRVDRVRILASSSQLPVGTELVDTPGTGSVHEANTAESLRARATVDIALLVVAADPPVSAAELALVSEVMSTAAVAAVVVNKIDLVGSGDVPEIVAFTRAATGKALGADVPTFPVSLRTGAGLAELVAWLTERLATQGRVDVVASTARALRRDTVEVLDGLRVEQELLRHTGQQSSDVATRLRDILDRAATSATAVLDHVRGQERRARAHLDEQHERQVAGLLRAVRREIGAALPGQDTPEREAAALRERIGDLVVARCTAWFDRIAPELDTTLRAAADRALTELGERLTAARRSAEDVLELRLAEVEPPAPRRPPALPDLRFGEVAEWRELITSTIARHLPDPIRRRRLHRHLLDWAENTAPRPLGRARSSLQSWLADTRRTIERDLSDTWRSQLAALQQGVEAAERHQEHTDTALSESVATVAQRISLVRGALSDLDAVLAAVDPATAAGPPPS